MATVELVTSNPETKTEPSLGGGVPLRALHRAGHGFNLGRRWFRAFRRTRPFWGGLWCILGGAWIIRLMAFPFLMALSGGFSYSAGYILGGALVLFGLVAWFAPHYKGLVGIMAFLVALAAFVAANLGGFLLGSILGILGGSMVWSWGVKKPRRRDRRNAHARARTQLATPLAVPAGEVRAHDENNA